MGLWGIGEKSVESGGKLDGLHTYLYDFPDPISKVGMQTKKNTNARTSLPVFGAESDKSMRHANAKLTG
jgi:hypothetical protein